MMVLQIELNRVQYLDSAVKELKRLDSSLTKHIKEMEDFESTSKQNRNKVLSGKWHGAKNFMIHALPFFMVNLGSSKALIEEEKFRKTGKRKYEHIVEKLTVAFYQAQYYMASTKSDLLSSPVLGLSHTAIAAIKGKGKSTERTELMHLHTTTHGTKRWSGDLIDAELSGQCNESHPPRLPNVKHNSIPVGSPTLKSESSTAHKKITTPAAAAVKYSQPQVISGGNVFANCLVSKDENTNCQNASKL